MANIKYDFVGKHFVVTGGAQGIGFQIAKNLMQSGAKVSVWDYSAKALENARSELSDFAASVQFTQVNVADYSACTAAASQLTGAIHGLINNAGITRDKSFAKMEEVDFDTVIETNLNGVFNVTKALLGYFDSASQNKRLINIASVVALYGNFGQANYVASKAGVIGLTKTLARELARKGFTVNAVAPGFIQTQMTAAMPPEVLAQMAAKVPVGVLGSTDDIANTCLFLCSDEARYINGAVLSVDGGLVC